MRVLAPGEAEDFHLGLTRADWTLKLAFHTVRLLVAQLAGTLTVADAELRLTAALGSPDSRAPLPGAPLPLAGGGTVLRGLRVARGTPRIVVAPGPAAR